MKFRTIVGMLLTAPVTAATLLCYVLPFAALGWLRYTGWHGPTDKSPLGTAPVWCLNDAKAPIWLQNMWQHWGGHTVGTAVVMKYVPGSSRKADVLLNHELHHVHQLHRIGVVQVLLYAASSLCAWVAGENAYIDNQFEVAARAAAGQILEPRSFFQGYGYGKRSAVQHLPSDDREDG